MYFETPMLSSSRNISYSFVLPILSSEQSVSIRISSDKCSSIEEYNLQIAEVDANAFASIIMVEYFKLQPQWNGLSDKVISAINDRINIIIRELND